MDYNIFTIQENTLTTDELRVASKGYRLKGGYKCILKYHTYAHHWGDNEHYRRFKTMETAYKYIDKQYPEFEGEIYE